MSLEQRHFSHDSKYRILICRSCGYVLSPNGVKKHLERAHSHLDLATRKELVCFATTLDLATTQEIHALRPDSKAVMGLKIESGFQCMECEYVCATEETVMAHCRKNHGWIKEVGPRWESCHVQRFFLGRNKGYFRVERPSEDPGLMVVDDLVQTLIDGKDRMEREQENRLTIVRGTQNKVDMTPWMQRTGYPQCAPVNSPSSPPIPTL